MTSVAGDKDHVIDEIERAGGRVADGLRTRLRALPRALLVELRDYVKASADAAYRQGGRLASHLEEVEDPPDPKALISILARDGDA